MTSKATSTEEVAVETAPTNNTQLTGGVLKVGKEPNDATGTDVSVLEVGQRKPGRSWVPKFRFELPDDTLLGDLKKGDRVVIDGYLGEGNGWRSEVVLTAITSVKPGEPMEFLNKADIVGKRTSLERKGIGDGDDYLYDLMLDVDGTPVCVKVRDDLRQVANETSDGDTLKITGGLRQRVYKGEHLFSVKARKIEKL